jgi:CHAT domain-containing protein/Tfp pilus assembly protein PilF
VTKARVSLATVLAIALLFVAGVPANSSELDPRVDAAVAVYRTAGAEQALPVFQQLVDVFKSSPQVHDYAATLHYVGECQWRLGRFDEARKYLDRALVVERGANDREGQGRTLNTLGLLTWDEGDYDQAINWFKSAGLVAASLGDKKLQGASLNNLSLVYDELGDYDVSLKQYQEVLQLYQGVDFPRGVGDTLGNIGGVHLLLGQFRLALGYYEQALQISERLESNTAMSQDHGNIALCLIGLGDIESAMPHFERAIELSRLAGMRQDEAYWTREKGNALIQQGQYDRGLELHRLAFGVYADIGAQAEQAEALHDTARLHLLLGDPDTAERNFNRSLELARTIGLARSVSSNLIALGDLQLRRKSYPAAAVLYEQARKRSAESGETMLLATSLLRLALVHREQAQLAQAAAEIDLALNIARESGARPVEAEGLLGRAEVQRRQQRLPEALKSYATAEAVLASIRDPDLLWQIHLGRARTYEAQGDITAAIDSLVAAVTLIESVRDRLQEPRFRAGYVDDKSEVYVELVRLQLQQGRTAEAFSNAERLRARSFAGHLAGRTSAALSPADRRTETMLMERVRHLQHSLAAEDDAGLPAYTQRARSRFSRELLLAEQEYQAFVDDHEQSRPPPDRLVAAEDLAGIERQLRDDEALLEYVVGHGSLTVFVVTNRGTTATTSVIRRADLDARIALFRDLVRRPGDDRWLKPAARLSSDLLASLGSDPLHRGVKRLFIVPHGTLNYLPFALLPTDGNGSSKLLLDRYTVAYLPAASALHAKTSPGLATQSLLAVAPARSRLRYAPEEARSIRTIYEPHAQALVGVVATESQFKNLAGDFRVLHLATHGLFNRINPLMSSLELEADGENDGLLQVHEVLGLRLDADLVTLSACETALGSGYFAEVPAGDEFVGMTRAFLTAGSDSVLATLWEVEDRASVALMKRFYKRMKDAGDTANAADALAGAQQDLRSDKDLAHPYYWAPYIVVGTINRRVAGG